MRRLLTAILPALVLTSCDAPERSDPPPSPTTPGVWEADSIIDVHGHTGTFAGYDLSLTTLRSNIDSFGIRMVLISNIDGANLPGTTLNLDARSANEATLQIVLKNSDRIRGLAWGRPSDGSPSDVEMFLRGAGPDVPVAKPFVGIKLHPVMNRFRADAPEVDPYFDLAGQYGVPIAFHSDKPGSNADPVRIYAAAKRHPDVPVILYHMVFFGPHDSAIDVVEQAVQNSDADLYLGTAQADPDAVLSAIQRVGSERVLFGTDATYFGRDHYGKNAELVSALRRELSEEEFADVVRNNARRLFDLQEERP